MSPWRIGSVSGWSRLGWDSSPPDLDDPPVTREFGSEDRSHSSMALPYAGIAGDDDAAATWGGDRGIVISATAGDVLQSRAMKEIGDLGAVRRSHGSAVSSVLSSPRFMIGLVFMALGFFSLLVTLSWDDVSVVGPASASLTFIANAFAAQIFLKEQVDRRRWLAAVFVAGGWRCWPASRK